MSNSNKKKTKELKITSILKELKPIYTLKEETKREIRLDLEPFDKEKIKKLANDLVLDAETKLEIDVLDIKKSYPENHLELIFAEAMIICAEKNNTEALNILKNICNPNHLETIFSEAMIICTEENNIKTLNILKNVCDPNHLETISFEALVDYVINDNDDMLDMAKISSLEAFSKVTIDCTTDKDWTIDKKEKALNRILKACPKELKEKVLKNVTDIDFLETASFEALVDYAINDNDDMLDIAKNSSLEAFSKVMIDSATDKKWTPDEKEKILEKVLEACPENHLKSISAEAMMIYSETNNTEALKVLKNTCDPDLLKTISFEALVDYAINKEEGMLNLAKNSSLEAFSKVMIDCATDEKLTPDEKEEMLNRVLKASPKELRKKVIKEAMGNNRIKKDKKIFKIVKHALSNYRKSKLSHQKKILNKLKSLTTVTNKDQIKVSKRTKKVEENIKDSKIIGQKFSI